MRIIISPAKKMNTDTDSLPVLGLPRFLDQTDILLNTLRCMSSDALKGLWKCNDSILKQNLARLETMDLRRRLTPAILAYEGIQYRYMAPGVFSQAEFDYVQTHLRILSGFYGVLKPFDGVVPYRLEMQAKLKTDVHRDLYSFWGSTLADALFSESDTVLNLASKEYSVCISKYLPEHIRFITCIFGEVQGSRVVEKGTLCKMARGEMVRYLAENQITDSEKIKSFDRLGYRFDEKRSNDNTYVFILQQEEKSND